ncbi:MAG: hypothetical protein Q7P63_12950 [Verrucomicrobiota bacterium JB022]|nr:hypothetical protein [Verrucomicrobiota bacterium JB022]
MPFSRHLIRLALDANSFEPPLDARRNAVPAFWSGRDVSIQFGLFDQGQLIDSGDLASFTFTLKRLPPDRSVPHWDDPVYLTRTALVTSNEVTPTEWTNGTDQHLVLHFTGDETQLEPGTYWLSATCTSKDNPSRQITFGAGPLEVFSDGYASGGVAPVLTGMAYSKAEADARFLTQLQAAVDYMPADQDLLPLIDPTAARAAFAVPSREECLQRTSAQRGGARLEAGQYVEGLSNGFNWGVGSGTVRLCLALDNWRPGADNVLWTSHRSGNNRWRWEIAATGDWRFVWTLADGSEQVATLPDPGLIDGSIYDLVLVVEPSASMVVYVDGAARFTVSLAAVAPANLGHGNNEPSQVLPGEGLSGELYDQLLVLNHALGAAEIARLALRPAGWHLLRTVSGANLLNNADFTAGGAGWATVVSSPAQLSYPAEGFLGSPSLKINRSAGGGTNALIYQNVNLAIYGGKALRFHFRYRTEGTDAVALLLREEGGSFTQLASADLPVNVPWRRMSLDLTVPTSISSALFAFYSTGVWRRNILWADDMLLTEVGVTMRVDLASGGASRLPSSNGSDWAVRGGEPQHLQPAYPGERRREATFWRAADIGTAAASNWLTTLRPGWTVEEVWLQVTTAGSAGEAVQLGTAANPTRWGAYSLAATGWQRAVPTEPWPGFQTEEAYLRLNQAGTSQFRLWLHLRAG